MNPGRPPSAPLWARAASGLEVLTGAGLVVTPSLLARLLFGSDLNAAGEATARIAGIVMACLAAGCWPRAGSAEAPALAPLMVLSWLAATFLVVTGFMGANVGIVLWPAAAAHLILAVLLTRAEMKSRARRHDETPQGGRTLARFPNRSAGRAFRKGWRGK